MSDERFPKQCRRCSRTYSETQWKTLALVGTMSIGLPLELRNCVCGNTIAVVKDRDASIVKANREDEAEQ